MTRDRKTTGPEKLDSAWLLDVALALPLALLAHRVVTNGDVFFQLRAGAEILAGHAVQRTDTWTTTTAGQPWTNLQWLSTALFALVARWAPGLALLPTLAAGIAFAFYLTLFRLIRAAAAPFAPDPRLCDLLVCALGPLAALALAFRMVLRPDTLALTVFAAQLLVWRAQRPSYDSRARWSVGLAVLGANVHAGTAPLGLIYSALAALFSSAGPRRPKPGRRLLYAGLTVAAFCATPLGPAAVAALARFFSTYNGAATTNSDQGPITAAHFELARASLVFWAWGLFSLCGLLAAIVVGRASLHPRFSPQHALNAALSVALLAATLVKARLIGYHVAATAPLIAEAAVRFVPRLSSARLRMGTLASLVLGGLLHAVVLVSGLIDPVGFGVSAHAVPVHAAEFIARERPSPELFTEPGLGNYFVYALPGYPVAFDSRDDLHAAAARPFLAARADAKRFSPFLAERGYNLAVEAPEPLTPLAGGRYTSRQLALYPPADWALVFFDDAAVVLARRLPENAALIARTEYKHLLRFYPAAYGALEPGLSAAERAAFEAELDRCLASQGDNRFCLVGKSFALRSRGLIAEADRLALRALAIAPDPALSSLIGQGL